MKLKDLLEKEYLLDENSIDAVHVWAKIAYAALSTAQHAPIQFAAVAEALAAAEEEL